MTLQLFLKIAKKQLNNKLFVGTLLVYPKNVLLTFGMLSSIILVIKLSVVPSRNP